MDTEEVVQNERSAKIAARNDAARLNASNYMMTRGIAALGPEIISAIYVRVQEFSKFTEDNDPYGEHDFGSFEVRGNKIFWKIDYYEPDLVYGIDPLDPECRRIITVMLAEEY